MDPGFATRHGHSSSYVLVPLTSLFYKADLGRFSLLTQSGSHFVRVGVVQLGAELQNRAVVRHGHWGAFGVSAYLSGRSRVLLEKPRTHLADAGVQTDHTHTTTMPSLPMSRPTLNSFLSDPTGSEDQALDLSNLTVDDLTGSF
jgi:hypothetical protein